MSKNRFATRCNRAAAGGAGGTDWGMVANGTVTFVGGLVTTAGGLAVTGTGVGAAVGAGVLITAGVPTMGFGIAKIARGFKGDKRETYGGLGETIDHGVGGDGTIGQIVDLTITGPPKGAVSVGLFMYSAATSNLAPSGSPNHPLLLDNSITLQKDNTNVVLPNKYR